MAFPIVVAMLLATGLVILGVANSSLFAWSIGAGGKFPIDRDDADDARLAKIGVDIMFGVLPIFAAMVLVVFAIDEPLYISSGQQLGAIVGCLAYLFTYFAAVRPRYGAFRLKLRQLRVSSRRES